MKEQPLDKTRVYSLTQSPSRVMHSLIPTLLQHVYDFLIEGFLHLFKTRVSFGDHLFIGNSWLGPKSEWMWKQFE